MEEMRERSSSITITIDNHNPIAYQLVRTALNGNTDDYVISLIEKCLNKNKPAIIYPDLPDRRDMLKLAPQLYDQHNRDYVIQYVINELTDHNTEIEQTDRRQKYIIAAIGAGTTAISSVAAFLAAYYTR